MKHIFIYIIKGYQLVFSPDQGLLVRMGFKRPTTCVFYPSCSEYTREVILRYGVLRGLFKGVKRITRCHPWQKHRIDPPR